MTVLPGITVTRRRLIFQLLTNEETLYKIHSFLFEYIPLGIRRFIVLTVYRPHNIVEYFIAYHMNSLLRLHNPNDISL